MTWEVYEGGMDSKKALGFASLCLPPPLLRKSALWPSGNEIRPLLSTLFSFYAALHRQTTPHSDKKVYVFASEETLIFS